MGRVRCASLDEEVVDVGGDIGPIAIQFRKRVSVSSTNIDVLSKRDNPSYRQARPFRSIAVTQNEIELRLTFKAIASRSIARSARSVVRRILFLLFDDDGNNDDEQ